MLGAGIARCGIAALVQRPAAHAFPRVPLADREACVGWLPATWSYPTGRSPWVKAAGPWAWREASRRVSDLLRPPRILTMGRGADTRVCRVETRLDAFRTRSHI